MGINQKFSSYLPARWTSMTTCGNGLNTRNWRSTTKQNKCKVFMIITLLWINTLKVVTCQIQNCKLETKH